MSESAITVWDQFFAINLSFPVAIFSFFLILSLLYWCVAALGMLDLEVLDFDADSPDAGSAAGLLMRFGLNGVPVTLVITLISLFGWFISAIVTYYIMPWIPTLILEFLVGVGILVLTFYLATMLTAWAIKPIRPAFLASNQQKVVMLIGQTAVVRTGTVTETFGEATLDDGGAGLIIKIRTYPGKTYSKGDRVVLLEQDSVEHFYRVISEKECSE